MSSSRQLAAIMFTDIVGYTAMMQADERKSVEIIKHYNSTLELLVNQFNGRIVNYYGDGSLCIFSSATDAVNCSLELQKELKAQPAVPLRIGLHIGEVIFEDEKALGDGVNVASRIQSLGEANSILISAEVHDKIKNNLSVLTQSLGPFAFKNVTRPMEVFAIANEGLMIPQRKKMTGKLAPKNTTRRNIFIGLALGIILLLSFIFQRKLFHANETSNLEKSIAVLPFADVSQNKDQEFFSDGLTEDIITQLAKIKSFKVISRTSTMQYKNKDTPLKEIANILGANIILEGSVQYAEGQVRINAQLIQASTDEHLWAETYNRSMKDIFAIQSDIASQIARALQANLSTDEQKRIEQKYTDNAEAYQLYLQGRFYWNKRLEEDVRKSIEFFRQAIQLDSSYALAYAGLGDAYLMLGIYSVLRPHESFPEAKVYAEKALQIDPSLAEAYSTLIDINIHYYRNADSAEYYFQKAVQSNPLYSNAYHWHSEVYDMHREFDKAIEESKRALELDPYLLIINVQYATNLMYAGKFNEAIQQLQKTAGYDSTFAITHYQFGLAYIGLKQYDLAVQHLRIASRLAPRRTTILSTLGYALGKAGLKNEAVQVDKELTSISQSKYVPAYDMAVMALGLGDEKNALILLQKAFDDREPWIPFIGVNPLFGSLKDDHQFQELVMKIEKQSSQ